MMQKWAHCSMVVVIGALAIISAIFGIVAVPVGAAEEDVSPPSGQLLDQNGQAISSRINLAPGEQKQIVLLIKNSGARAKINVKVNNLQTTDDGIASDVVMEDRLLPQSAPAVNVFTVDGLGKAFLLAAGQQKRVPITITAPTKAFTGKQSYVVAIAAAPVDELSKAVTVVTNVRVDLANSPAPLPKATLKFSEIKAGDYFGRIGFVMRVENPFGNDVKASSLVAQVYSAKDGGVVATRALRPISVAPFSYFTFFVPVQSVTVQDYRVRLSMVQKGQTTQKSYLIPVKQMVGGAVSQTAMLRNDWAQKIIFILFVLGPVGIIGMQLIKQRHRLRMRLKRLFWQFRHMQGD